jgi:hypothetical protein
MAAEAPRQITTETKLSLPLNGSIFTTTSICAAEKSALALGTSMASEIGVAWKTSLVIDCNYIPTDGNKREMRITHARIPREADQLSSNWEFSTCSIGGRQFPSVQRTVILLSNVSYQPSGTTFDIFAHATPAIGSAMPVETGSPFTGAGYILADRQVVKSGMQLEPVFVVERRNYIIRTSRKNIGTDPLNGKPLWSETSLYYQGETVSGMAVETLFADSTNAYWGLQTNGTRRTGQRLSCAWYAITTELVVAGTEAGGIVAIDSYESTVDFYWPPVLQNLEFMDWDRRDGGTDIYARNDFNPDGYSGPCTCIVTRTWSRTPVTGLTEEKMLPTPVIYMSPFFRLSIPACLHGELSLVCDIGNSDPYYKQNTGSTRTVEASKLGTSGSGTSNCTDWPSTIRAYDSQVPFRGGYLRTVRIIDAPNT